MTFLTFFFKINHMKSIEMSVILVKFPKTTIYLCETRICHETYIFRYMSDTVCKMQINEILSECWSCFAKTEYFNRNAIPFYKWYPIFLPFLGFDQFPRLNLENQHQRFLLACKRFWKKYVLCRERQKKVEHSEKNGFFIQS